MAGLFLLPFDLWRTSPRAHPYFPACLFPRLCPVPPVRYLEALAGQLGRPEAERRHRRDDRRRHRRIDGGRPGGAGAHRVSYLMFPPDLLSRAEHLLATARAGGVRIATAESCTGGLI